MSISSLYPSIRPSLLLDFSNTKQLDPRITFSRPTTATYYDGKTVVKAEENLVKYSEQFDNAAWVKGASSVTANTTTAPDGNSTADLLIPDTTTSSHYVSQSITASAPFVVSFYAKSGGYSHVGIASNANNYVYFDISGGTVESTLGTGWLSANITSVGNGWYRCSAISSLACTLVYLFAYNATQSNGNTAPSFTGDGTSGIYLWGAQLEQRSTVTAYTPTTTAPITNYIPVLQTAVSNDARFDHDPVTGESKGLLIEEQRTNLLTYSEQFDNAAWSRNALPISANTIVAPDGTLTADKAYADATTDQHFAGQSVTLTATGYTVSCYAKAGGYSWLLIRNMQIGNAFFDLANGAVGTVTSPMTASMVAVGNGWYRCSMSFTGTAVSTAFRFGPTTANSVTSFLGDGYSGIYIWGAQLEAGSFPTSYIPTVASQVTRSADSASMTGSNFSSWYRADEGTLYGEASFYTVTNTKRDPIASLYSSNNCIEIGRAVAGSTTSAARLFVLSNGATSAYIAAGTLTANTPAKLVGSYAVNNFNASLNGAAVVSDTDGQLPFTLNTLYIGNGQSAESLCGTIKRIAYYPKRLSNQELQGLTS